MVCCRPVDWICLLLRTSPQTTRAIKGRHLFGNRASPGFRRHGRTRPRQAPRRKHLPPEPPKAQATSAHSEDRDVDAFGKCHSREESCTACVHPHEISAANGTVRDLRELLSASVLRLSPWALCRRGESPDRTYEPPHAQLSALEWRLCGHSEAGRRFAADIFARAKPARLRGNSTTALAVADATPCATLTGCLRLGLYRRKS